MKHCIIYLAVYITLLTGCENKKSHDAFEKYVINANLFVNYNLRNQNMLTQNIYCENDSVLDKIKIKNMGYMLVFRFFDVSCQPCVDSQIKLLNEKFPDIKDQVFILTSYSDRHNLSTFKRINGIDREVFQTDSIVGLSYLEEKKVPYFFVFDTSGCIQKIMIPEKKLPGLTVKYLNSIKRIILK
jgi:hypothetical protein